MFRPTHTSRRSALSLLAAAGFAVATLTAPPSVSPASAMPAAPAYAPSASLQPDLAQYRRHHAPRRHVRRGGGGNAGAAAAAMVGVLALGALAASAAQSYDYDDYYAPAPVYGGYGYGYGYAPQPYYRPRPAYRPHYVAPYQGPRYYRPNPYGGPQWSGRHGANRHPNFGPPENQGGK